MAGEMAAEGVSLGITVHRISRIGRPFGARGYRQHFAGMAQWLRGWPKELVVSLIVRASERQYTAPRPSIGQSCSTRPSRMATYQS